MTTPDLDRPEVRDLGDRYGIFVDASDVPAGFTQYVEHTEEDGTRVRIFPHTEVGEAFSGQGLASTLVREALDDSIASGWRIVPVCPYVKRWIDRHTGYEEHVVSATGKHLRALRGSMNGSTP
ncbi:GNAT family N-acetyltransferase [Micrococcus sp.]|uniref:GNAT family N-acetyltransferase n=1 Tax=Micrococcus sp. TaxID=1271 RepID=UPI002A91A4C6|nr:GNAT family N-acetyltransferase [Micrococcus sp.]MDY6055780.1 GNAT family N-acetyltransferase [Micrococcus sp.]